jgi:hypothetical protein
MSRRVSKQHRISITVGRRNYWPGHDTPLAAERRVTKIQVLSNTDIAPLFVYRSLLRYIDGRRRRIEMLYITKFLFTHFYGRGALRGVCTSVPRGVRFHFRIIGLFISSFLPPRPTSILSYFPHLSAAYKLRHLFIFTFHIFLPSYLSVATDDI